MRNTVTTYGAGPRTIPVEPRGRIGNWSTQRVAPPKPEPVEPDGPSAATLGDRPMLVQLAGHDRERVRASYDWGRS